MKRTLIVLLSAIVLFAGEITGGFGIKLGSKITDHKNLKVLSKSKNEDGTLLFKVIPPKKADFLNLYMLRTSPKSKVIYQIMGSTIYDDMSSCNSKLDFMKTALEKKYGNSQPLYHNSFKRVYLILNKNRGIVFGCENNFDNATFLIIYLDKKLEKQAIKEAVENNKKVKEVF